MKPSMPGTAASSSTLFERLARLDLRQDEHLAVRARDPVLLLFGPEEKAVRAHRREPAEALRRILRRLDEASHVVRASRRRAA